MPRAIRERPMTVAAARKSVPARREKANTAKAIAKAAAAWSLGNDGSVVRAPRTCVSAGWDAKGRGRSHRWAIAWFVNKATPAATRAEAQASFHRGFPYGRARSQRPTVARA